MERDLIDEVQIQPNHSKVHPIPIPSNADAALKFLHIYSKYLIDHSARLTPRNECFYLMRHNENFF